MLHWLTDQVSGSPITYLVVAFASGADVLVPLIPSEAVVISASVIAANGGLFIWLIVPLVAAGAVIGDNIAYLLGATLGERAARRVFRSPANHARLAWAERAVARRGAVLIVIGRFIPGGRTASTFAAGMLEMPWRRFIVADVIAALLWALYTAMLGYLGGATFGDNSWKPILGALGVASLITLGLETLRRVRRRRGLDILGDELPDTPVPGTGA